MSSVFWEKMCYASGKEDKRKMKVEEAAMDQNHMVRTNSK